MKGPRLLRILSVLAAAGPPLARQLCDVSAEVLAVAGAGIMVEGAAHRTPLCASDTVATRIEDLCFTLGEGPGVDAHQSGGPVAEPDLARPRQARWPSFTPLAVDAGVGAIFSFPLRLGGVHLGALTLYQARPGALSDDQHADATIMATVVLETLLAHQAEAPPGALATELEPLSGAWAEVHQASGMVSVQLGVSVVDALVRLRAHAYAAEWSLLEVARDVVAGRLRLSE